MNEESLVSVSPSETDNVQIATDEKNDETLSIEQNEKDKWYVEDRDKFIEKYPQIQTEELFTDESFIKFANGKVGNESMTDIYEGYLSLCDEIEKRTLEKAEKEFANRIAKAKATPGSLTENTQKSDALYSLEEMKNMSRKAIEANWDKVQRSIRNLKKEK